MKCILLIRFITVPILKFVSNIERTFCPRKAN